MLRKQRGTGIPVQEHTDSGGPPCPFFGRRETRTAANCRTLHLGGNMGIRAAVIALSLTAAVGCVGCSKEEAKPAGSAATKTSAPTVAVPRPAPAPPPPPPPDPLVKYEADLQQSDALCERMKVDINTYYRKPQTITTFVEPADYYNYKYQDARATHYSFATNCGGHGPLGLYAYGRKAKFKDLFEYLMSNPGVPVQLTIITDESHEDNRVFTLQAWKQLVEASASDAQAHTGALSEENSEKLCERMKVDISSYYAKPQIIITSAEPDDYYNYKYQDAASSYYSFKTNCGGLDSLGIHAFAAKAKFKDLFDYLMANKGAKVQLTIITDDSHGSNDIFTLQAWQKVQ